MVACGRDLPFVVVVVVDSDERYKTPMRVPPPTNPHALTHLFLYAPILFS
jgi:hypothetical protein